MFTLLLRLKRRIKRLLRVTSETRQSAPQTVHSQTTKFLLLVLISLLVGVLYPGEELYDPLDMPRKGEIALDGVVAPFQITVLKTERELEEEKDRYRMSVPLVVDYNTTATDKAHNQLARFFSLVDSLSDTSLVIDSTNPSTPASVLEAEFPLMSQAAIGQSLALDSVMVVHERLDRLYRTEIYPVGVLPDADPLPEIGNRSVLIRRGESSNIYPRERLLSTAVANGRLLTALNKLATTDPINVEYHYLVGRSFIQPNLQVNMVAYEERVSEELAAISEVKETVGAGEVILRSGTKVSQRQERILGEMARVLRTQAAQEGWVKSIMPAIGRILLVLAAFAALYAFLFLFRREVFNSTPKLLALLMVFSVQLVLIYLADRQFGLDAYLFPVALLPVLVTALFDAEIGILATLVLAMLLGILNRFDFSLAMMTVLVGTVACIAARRVRKRTHFFNILALVAIAYVGFVFLVENIKLTPNEEILTAMGFGLINSAVVAFLAIGLLPFFESLFSITTDITLLELSDLNHPLLKRLALEAPGTYHHSIQVGHLAEAGAKAIECNSLLARVGTYYHDIGKMEIPEYFVENQLSVKSRHDLLTPTMSALVLSSHVKKGRMLGEAADIPDDILNFIEEHHGTMVMTYFYNRALEQGGDDVDIDKFRYPGPRPQSRETGIAMLADAVEAASRTLEDPKPARIINLIQQIINDRFRSGELDECPLTLRDLARIREAFAQVLIGSFHHRVVYPKRKESGGVNQ